MKNILTTAAGLLLVGTVFGQAVLPTGWNFDDPTPTGWVESLDNNPGLTRYVNGQSGAACKLDGDHEYVLVNFSDVCGSVSYYIKGQGTATNDVFSIQESVDGNTWTDLRVLNQSDIDATVNAYVQFTDMPNAASRFIRWYFTNKQTGRNIALDEIDLEPQVATAAQEIAINVAGTPVVNNSTYIIGNVATTTFTIENVNLAGGDTLHVSDIQVSGPNASEFTVSGVSAPFGIGAQASQNVDINFSTAQMGSRFATLTITNDDANGDETSYMIDLYGIGGDYATEPTAQPTNFSFTNVTSYKYDVSFDDATSVPEKYIVLRNIGSAVPDVPVDGQTYVKGDYINGSQVVYVGDAGSFRPKYVVAGTDYHFAAFSVNGPSGYENYLTASPLIGNITSSGSMVGNYYDGIDANATTFLTDLQTKLGQNYNQIYYSNYAPVMLEKFASRDTTGGQTVITGVYSGYQYLYTGPFFFDVLSREHSWCHSWMPTYPDDQGMEYSDLHNLFPVHQNSANAVRSNYPLGVVVNEVSSFMGAKYGDDANGNRVYEPRDQHKGDAARAIFYMAAKWNGTGGTWEFPNPIDFLISYGQDQDVLKQWHWQDPPDAWEIARNDFVESEQGDRNPFVDSVNWVCYIDFENFTYIGEQTTPCTVTPEGIAEALEGDFSISPNPTNGIAALNLNLKEAQQLSIDVMDITGRTVATRTRNFNVGVSREMFDLTSLDAGVYHVILRVANGRTALKVVLQ